MSWRTCPYGHVRRASISPGPVARQPAVDRRQLAAGGRQAESGRARQLERAQAVAAAGDQRPRDGEARGGEVAGAPAPRRRSARSAASRAADGSAVFRPSSQRPSSGSARSGWVGPRAASRSARLRRSTGAASRVLPCSARIVPMLARRVATSGCRGRARARGSPGPAGAPRAPRRCARAAGAPSRGFAGSTPRSRARVRCCARPPAARGRGRRGRRPGGPARARPGRGWPARTPSPGGRAGAPSPGSRAPGAGAAAPVVVAVDVEDRPEVGVGQRDRRVVRAEVLLADRYLAPEVRLGLAGRPRLSATMPRLLSESATCRCSGPSSRSRICSPRRCWASASS
jgi:hypothetical protein